MAVTAGATPSQQWLVAFLDDDHIADQAIVFTREVVEHQAAKIMTRSCPAGSPTAMRITCSGCAWRGCDRPGRRRLICARDDRRAPRIVEGPAPQAPQHQQAAAAQHRQPGTAFRRAPARREVEGYSPHGQLPETNRDLWNA
jgi:hypothetical protein